MSYSAIMFGTFLGGRPFRRYSMLYTFFSLRSIGILRCPVCGCGMYGNVNRKKKGGGTYYKDYFYYACKHRLHVDGKRCDYHHQWGEDVIDSAVEGQIYSNRR